MRRASIGLALALTGCSFLFDSADQAAFDAGQPPDACVPGQLATDRFPSIPLNARYLGITGASDDNDGLSPEQPWANFATSLQKLEPGQTLVILNGRYTQDLNVLAQGTEEKPIRIMAETNGGVTIDSEGSGTPCGATAARFVEIIGFRCVSTGNLTPNPIVHIRSESQNVRVRWITATGTVAGSPTIYIENSNKILLEDVATKGANRTQLEINRAEDLEIRRFFSVSAHAGQADYMFSSTDCKGCLFQNLLLRGAPSTTSYGVQLQRSNLVDRWGDDTHLLASLIYDLPNYGVVTKGTEQALNRNKLSHLVIADRGNGRTANGIFQRNGSSFLIDNVNLVNLAASNLNINEDAGNSTDISTNLHNSIFVGGENAISTGDPTNISSVTSSYNNFFDVVENYKGGVVVESSEIRSVDPAFLTDDYGFGAYLMQPAALQGMGVPPSGGMEERANIGAEVLYRYENGQKTDIPLWPWPMEDRIEAELEGYRATMADALDVKSGIWKDLDGVYPAVCQ